MTAPTPDEPDDGFEVIADGAVTWRVERDFVLSRWTCIYGRGCLGILDEPAEELAQGCCSIGADLGDEDEARMIGALAATLSPEQFQHHDVAQTAPGIYRDEHRIHTRIVDGACIFLNRPGFPGGPGCALHRAALEEGDSPVDWKPSVCWQLPIKVDWAPQGDGTEIATLRRWNRRDWDDEGDSMAWCCTVDDDRAYVGDRPVLDSLATELREVVGEPVYVELRRRLTPAEPVDTDGTDGTDDPSPQEPVRP